MDQPFKNEFSTLDIRDTIFDENGLYVKAPSIITQAKIIPRSIIYVFSKYPSRKWR